MPTYDFVCPKCGLVIELILPMSEIDVAKVECSACNERMTQQFSPPTVSVPHTVGSIADKRKVSIDEQESLKPKREPSWACDGDKIVRTNQLTKE